MIYAIKKFYKLIFKNYSSKITTPFRKKAILSPETVIVRKLNVGLNKGENPCLIFDLLSKHILFSSYLQNCI